MKYRPHECEVCSANDWQLLGKRVYSSSEIEKADNYNRKRFRVLFEKWFPNSLTVELEYLCCKHCGFAMYSPRPEESDVNNKYRFLEELGQDYGQTPFSSPGERKRSQDILEYLCKRIILAEANDVLDYGGGDGRLMQAFQEKEMSYSLVDYNKSCLPGIRKLADTIDELPPAHTFDLIICSHVIEHVAEPLKVIKALSQHLRPNAYLFVEVPLEIWKRAPIQSEPVTHINFFTPNSMWNLLSLAGLQPFQSELTSYLHPHGKWLHAVRALATRSATQTSDCGRVLRNVDVNKYIQPNIFSKLQYYLANTRGTWCALKYKLCGK